MAELIEGETVYDEIKISHEKSLVVSWDSTSKNPCGYLQRNDTQKTGKRSSGLHYL